MLIYNGALINVPGESCSALHRAVEAGSYKICQLLINSGANIDSISLYGKYTPLHLSAFLNKPQITTLLLANSACILQRDFGDETAYQLAVFTNSKDIIKILDIYLKKLRRKNNRFS